MLAGAGRDGIDIDIPYDLSNPDFDLSNYPVFYKAAGTNWRPTTNPYETIPSYWIVKDYVAP